MYIYFSSETYCSYIAIYYIVHVYNIIAVYTVYIIYYIYRRTLRTRHTWYLVNSRLLILWTPFKIYSAEMGGTTTYIYTSYIAAKKWFYFYSYNNIIHFLLPYTDRRLILKWAMVMRAAPGDKFTGHWLLFIHLVHLLSAGTVVRGGAVGRMGPYGVRQQMLELQGAENVNAPVSDPQHAYFESTSQTAVTMTYG